MHIYEGKGTWVTGRDFKDRKKKTLGGPAAFLLHIYDTLVVVFSMDSRIPTTSAIMALSQASIRLL